jgi:transposase
VWNPVRSEHACGPAQTGHLNVTFTGGAHFAALRRRRGEPKAIGAIRHDLLVAYYHIVRDQVPFREPGPDWQHKRYSPEHRARRLQRQLEALGYKVNLEQAEKAA